MAPTSTRTLFWTPTAKQIEESPDTLFREFVNRRLGLRLRDYDELHAWSIKDLNAFWTLASEYTGVVMDRTCVDEPAPPLCPSRGTRADRLGSSRQRPRCAL